MCATHIKPSAAPEFGERRLQQRHQQRIHGGRQRLGARAQRETRQHECVSENELQSGLAAAAGGLNVNDGRSGVGVSVKANTE